MSSVDCRRPEKMASNLGVAQLVARYLGVVEAASSSLVTQTKKHRKQPFSMLFSFVFAGIAYFFAKTAFFQNLTTTFLTTAT